MKRKSKFSVGQILILLVFICLAACQKATLKGGNVDPLPTNPVPPGSTTQVSLNGIGGYNFNHPFDKAFAFDFGHTGRQDHVACYRPGSGIFWVLTHALMTPTQFLPIYQTWSGIGGYNLNVGNDLVFPFDYEHSGKQDYLICYRPGQKHTWILRNNNHFPYTNLGFSPVISSANGLGGYDMGSSNDRLTPFDYTHSGKLDYLLAYRSASKFAWILKNNDNGTFSPVLQSTNGLGEYPFDAGEANDQAFAYDFDHSGKQDHLVCFNTGHLYIGSGSVYAASIYILKNNNGVFTTAAKRDFGHSGWGIQMGGVTLQATPYDFDHSGRMDYLVVYSPGIGEIDIVRNDATLTSVFHSYNGIAEYNLNVGDDRIFAYDYEGTGKQDYLFMSRAGQGIISIIKHNADGSFSQVL